MLIDMILRSIPKSWQAAVSLVVTIGGLNVGFMALQDIIVGTNDSAWTVTKCLVGLVAGTIAGLYFYYFQHRDGDSLGVKYDSLETLDNYYGKKNASEKQSKITLAYPNEVPPAQAVNQVSHDKEK